jgi:hypothetical protein
MALRTDIKEEKVALDTIVKGSLLGKHINERILRPILDDIAVASNSIMEDLGFMIVSELQHRLATAPAGNTYKVYMINEAVEGKGRYTFVGYYTASAKDGPPASGVQTDSGLPTGSLYESIWYGVDREGVLSVTIESPQGSERNYFFQEGLGVVVGGTKMTWPTLPVAEYFKILNNKTRPNWWGKIIDRKREYWNAWMQQKFQKAIKGSLRGWMAHRVLKFNIYWESK